MPVILTDQTAADKTVILWDSHLDRVALNSVNDEPQNPATNAILDETFSYWGQAGTGGGLTRLIKVGSDFPITCNALGISGHNLGSTGSTLFLTRSEDLVTYTNVIAPYSPLTDEDLFFIFPVETNLHWQIAFGNSTGAYVSNVKLGRRLEFPCTPIVGYKPTHHSRKYTKYFNNSVEGHLLGNRVMSSGGSTTVDFPEIPRDFVDGPMRGFEDHYNRGRSFFYAGWPGGKPQDMAYAWADGEDAMIDVTYTGGDKLATVGFGMSLFYGR